MARLLMAPHADRIPARGGGGDSGAEGPRPLLSLCGVGPLVGAGQLSGGRGFSHAGCGLVEDWALVRMGEAWAGPWSGGGARGRGALGRGHPSGLGGLSTGSGGAGRRPRLREPHSGAGLLGRRGFYWLVGGFSGLTMVCRRDFWAEGACVGAELPKRGD